MVINVKRSHIERGQRRVMGYCPVALAFQEATGRPCIVTGRGTVIDARGKYASGLEQWIRDFDSGLKVWPISFTVEGL